MKLTMEKVLERDIDLLLLRGFLSSQELTNHFLRKAHLQPMQVEDAQHSVMTQDGESDVTIILTDGLKRFALLIEDKIDAIAMPQQHYRYHLRGQQGIREGKYDEYAVFIVAPQTYLDENAEAKKYEHQIPYEELAALFPEESFDRLLLEEAIREKQKSYTPIEDTNVTAFWRQFYSFCAEYFPTLSPYIYDGPRGTNAVWPTFRTGTKRTIIQHKSNHGYIDLEISGYANERQLFMQTNRDLLDNDMSVETAGKSLAIRLKVPKVDFHRPFTESISDISICLHAAMRLQNLSKMISIFREEDG